MIKEVFHYLTFCCLASGSEVLYLTVLYDVGKMLVWYHLITLLVVLRCTTLLGESCYQPFASGSILMCFPD